MTSEFQLMPEENSNTPLTSPLLQRDNFRSLWAWVPSVYFAQGLPYAIVISLMVIVYKTMGWSNPQVAFYTSILYLPWVLKPLWSGCLEFIATKKFLLCWVQVIKALLLVLILLSFSASLFVYSFIGLLLLGFCSATFDTVSDGVYLVNLSPQAQAYFVGIRSVSYQLARLFVVGGMVVLFGLLIHHYSVRVSWQIVFLCLAGITVLQAIAHFRVVPDIEQHQPFSWSLLARAMANIVAVFREFFCLPSVVSLVVFLLLYNLAEAQLLKIVPLFFLDTVSHGGLGLKTYVVGWLGGALGIACVVLGATVGGAILSRFGLKKCLLIITVLMALGTSGYFILAFWSVTTIGWVVLVVVLAQITYGVANSAYMLYLMQRVSKGQHPMSFYALGTSFMALGMLVPGSVSGIIQGCLGYAHFFEWIMLLSVIIIFYVIFFVKCEQ